MEEKLLHYAWQTGRFNDSGLTTVTGERVQILNPGKLNPNQGPDFLNASLRLGELTFFGHLEFHLSTADWVLHRHHIDPGYNAVILHVVYESNRAEVFRQDGTQVPEVELKARLPVGWVQRYAQLMAGRQPILCADLVHEVPEIIVRQWLTGLGSARIQQKAEEMMHSEQSPAWAELLWQELAGAVAGPVNKAFFRQLAECLPVKILQKYANELPLLEALLLGMAGLLDTQVDEYTAELQVHWWHLAAKHSLHPLEAHNLKFLRMRPVNFPTLRLAQLAALVHSQPEPLALLDGNLGQLMEWLAAEPSAYWLTHFRPGVEAGHRRKKMGAQTIRLILINALIPFAVLYHRHRGDAEAAEKAIEMLEALPAESNSIILLYNELGVKPKQALESQGLLQLYRLYCQEKQCLKCAIGHHIFQVKVT